MYKVRIMISIFQVTKVTILKVLSLRKFSHETIRKSSRVIMQDYSWQCPNGEYWNGNGAV